jgi:hypothetical protein
MFESCGHCSRTEETEQQRENHETQGKRWRKHSRTPQKNGNGNPEMEILKAKQEFKSDKPRVCPSTLHFLRHGKWKVHFLHRDCQQVPHGDR